MRTGVRLVFSIVLAAVCFVAGRFSTSRESPAADATVEPSQTVVPRRIANSIPPPPPPDSMKKAESDIDLPFSSYLTSAEKGYQAASKDLAAAFAEMDGIHPAESKGFVTGVFTFVARTFPPTEALRMVKDAPDKFKHHAWRALAAEWVYSNSSLDEQTRLNNRDEALSAKGSKLGLEVGLSYLLGASRVEPGVSSAWLEAFRGHSGRSEMLMAFLGDFLPKNPESVLQRMNGWTDWEKERVTERFLLSWADQEPEKAWRWASGNAEMGGPHSMLLLSAWADRDPNGLINAFGELPARHRPAALEMIAKSLASSDPQAAQSWVERFSNPADRAHAQRGVSQGTPQGIGAILSMEDGFPLLRGIVPESALDGTGIKPGDRLVEVQNQGHRESLYGRDLSEVVNRLRGETGSQVEIKVLRSVEGRMEEHWLRVERKPLILQPNMLKKLQSSP